MKQGLMKMEKEQQQIRKKKKLEKSESQRDLMKDPATPISTTTPANPADSQVSKKEDVKHDDPDTNMTYKVLCQPRWWVGIVFQVVGALTQVVCLTFAEMTLLAVNCVWAIFFNQILAILFLGEKFKAKYDLPAIVLLSAGAILQINASYREDASLDASLLREYIFSFRTVLVFILVIGLIIIATLLRNRVMLNLEKFQLRAQQADADMRMSDKEEKKYILPQTNSKKKAKVTKSDDDEAGKEVKSIAEEDKMPYAKLLEIIFDMDTETFDKVYAEKTYLKRYMKFPLWIATLAAGLCSGVASLAAKIQGEFVEASTGDENLGLIIGCVVIMCIGVFCLQLQMNNAMLFYQQMEVLPLYQSNIVLAWTITGCLVLREMQGQSTGRIVMLASGVILVLIGSKILTSKGNYQTG